MPRLARTVFAGVPHHITQRGNRREDVFYVEEDYKTYLEWLSHYSQQHQLEILAYCLMTNHAAEGPAEGQALHFTCEM